MRGVIIVRIGSDRIEHEILECAHCGCGHRKGRTVVDGCASQKERFTRLWSEFEGQRKEDKRLNQAIMDDPKKVRLG
jgi:hypothetical protein